jgi:hypothetical protein
MHALRENEGGGGCIPGAGQVWWRAAARARLEAAQTAGRPLTWLHGVAGACAAGLAVALLGFAWPVVRQSAAWIGEQLSRVDPQSAELAELVGVVIVRSLPFAAVAAACLVLAPLALFLVLSDE